MKRITFLVTYDYFAYILLALNLLYDYTLIGDVIC